ncbi:bifunctional serine/threonine-protein kinase/formylglycine-generating enzyme family protein [Chamaesiphon sp. OTE_8_metabat_110]|uniref:bifunctional serine/threonine-protein kinase/formylglycine-generating enzyme family protein n=1 Tax=Chamaesiphon sp. OTE_8_metabat_110 TaxID=2964696 RepID=UPI00286AADB1|nr:bifunctional serine/threonine-protein kinase/formylglycine-generating enzyme family protein [Chamaesiphon sp. OTE_8_metabat_110]
MSYCINPLCPAPTKNSHDTNFCLACGARLFLKDRYRAQKLLGQGGFGKTFKAVDEYQSNQPLCVIKQFAFNSDNAKIRQTALDLFYEEAKHLETLGKHAQIPELFAYFDIKGQPYLVQQFIDGQDLQQEVVREGAFNQHQVRELLLSLLPVLDFLHHQSPPIIHRDIKPANIIRRQSDRVLVLVDFGAAKQATQTMLAKTGTVIGSPEYVAPEQVRGKPAFASDIYSLGVTCIYLLTQVSPFDLFDLSQDAWAWRDYLVDNIVDESLGKILDKMIANALSQRYQSASDVLVALGTHRAAAKVAGVREPVAVNIDRQAKISPESIARQQSQPHDRINIPELQPFGFETARLVSSKTLWGSNKLIVKKSSGQANRFFEELSGGVRLQMVNIPAGTFMMGAPELEDGSSAAQRPQHRVNIPSFYMGKSPVTQAQYEMVMGSNPAYFQGGDRPVETVSWHDAIEFCQKLSQLTARHYRLPTEAEWEFACRAGTTTAFYFGETISLEVANYRSEETTLVGSFPANGYGLDDMHGNILEWCADNYHGSYIGAPADGSAWANEANPTRVLRGGSWYSKPSYCRSAARIYYQPNHRCSYFGFRVVCDRS